MGELIKLSVLRFCLHHMQELVPLIARRFGNPGDVPAAQAMVEASNGIHLTREMAAQHAAAAVAAVSQPACSCQCLAHLMECVGIDSQWRPG